MKQILSTFLVAVLILSTFISFAQANPFQYFESVPPPPGSTPLRITVLSPQNNTVQKENNVNLTLNIDNEGTSILALHGSYLTADWLEGNTSVFWRPASSGYIPLLPWNFSKLFLGIPDGKHTITIYAWGNGQYVTDARGELVTNGQNQLGLTSNTFDMTAISTIIFTVDSISPEVTINSPLANASYSKLSIPLNFTTDENATLITYSFDGQKNQTYSQTSTLIGLSEGKHNLTVYAWDKAGNVGTSQTTYFTVESPKLFPTTIIFASVAGFAIIAAGLLVYFKKRKP